MDKSTSFSTTSFLNCCGKLLTLDEVRVMGIINLTPDSFYDGGKVRSIADAIYKVEKMIKEGADIIDIGAVSTRPGAPLVSPGEELNRLVPVLEAIVGHFPGQIISVDTYRSEVAKIAIENGAGMINDISAGTFDQTMFETVKKLNVPYVMMHIKGTPASMQLNPVYSNLVKEIKDYFYRQIALFNPDKLSQIIIDPGFGFGKTLENNYSLLKHLNEFKTFGYPLLAGLSRKSMINKVLKTQPLQALNGTTVVNTLAIISGADMLRVHDVKEARETVMLCREYFNAG